MPFGLRSVGHARYAPREGTQPRVVDFVHLIWTNAGTGVMERQGREFQIPVAHVGVYLPGMQHRLAAARDAAWEYWWITLDGPFAGSIMQGFGFEGPPFDAGKCPVAMFRGLEKLIQEVGPTGEKDAAGATFQLLVHIAKCRQFPDSIGTEEGDLALKAAGLVRDNLGDCTIGVTQIANALRVHRSVLTRKFEARFGIAPKEYMDALRLQRVLTLLKGSSLPIGEIARRAGFSDPNYLSKFFHKRMGQSPTEFRQASQG